MRSDRRLAGRAADRVSLQLALCLVCLSAWPAPHTHADAPLRLALRVASDDERALLPRLRGQLSDTTAQLVIVETGQLEATFSDQLSTANALAKAHNADALVWCTNTPQPSAEGAAPQHLVHILLPRSDRILTRELTSSTQGPLSSSELETAALLIRSALIALTQNTQLGSPIPEALAATSVNQADPQGPQIGEPPTNITTPGESPPTAAANEASTHRVASAIASRPQAPDDTSSQRDAAPQAATSELATSHMTAPSDGPEGRGRVRWGVGSDLPVESSFDSAAPEIADADGAAPAPLRARLALGAQLAVDGQSIGGQRGLYASVGFGAGNWALSVFGAVSLASELADEYFALNVARHAVGVAVERKLPLTDAWSLGLGAHAGALLLRRTSLAKSDAVVSYPASLVAAFAFGPELALRWLHDLFGVALRVALDVLPAAPRFESAGLRPQHARSAHSLWAVQPRVALGWEIALP